MMVRTFRSPRPPGNNPPTDAGNETFRDLLATKIEEQHIEARHVSRALVRYHGQVTTAIQNWDVTAAVEVYHMAVNLPATYTQAQLFVQGYHLTEDSLADLIVCFKGIRPCVLKSLDDPFEHQRVVEFSGALAASNASVPHLVPFELVDAGGSREVKIKMYQAMPRYPTTLDSMPFLPGEGGVGVFWEQMFAALSGIHALGFAHMDIKPSNVCLSELEMFVLIDLGSVARFGEKTVCTKAYVPRDFDFGGTGGGVRSSALADWWMLGATLAEKGCGENGTHLGFLKVSPTMDALRSHLQKNLLSGSVFEKWEQQIRSTGEN